MEKYILITMIALMWALPAGAVVHEDFETDYGDDGVTGENGISLVKWAQVDPNGWERSNVGNWISDTYIAWSQPGQDECATGVLASDMIALGSDNALSIDHAGYYGGPIIRDDYFYSVSDRNIIEVYGIDDPCSYTEPNDLNDPCKATLVGLLLAQSDPLQNTFVDLIDGGYTHVVIKAIDVYDCFEGGGHGWVGFDNVETITKDPRIMLTNGGFFPDPNGWEITGNAWGICHSAAGDDQPCAPEGGLCMGSRVDGESATGIISQTNTVQGPVLAWLATGHEGAGGECYYEVLNDQSESLIKIAPPGSDYWEDKFVVFSSIGLGMNDTFTFRAVDNAAGSSYAWCGLDYVRQGDLPVPPDTCITPPAYDLNGDCETDILDIGLLASEWLDCGLADQGLCHGGS